MRHLRYLLSKIVPVPMHSTYAIEISGADVQTGAMPWLDTGTEHGVVSVKPGTNHFRDDDHHDLVDIRWWQWRGRCMRQRTVTTCIGEQQRSTAVITGPGLALGGS